MAMELNLNDLEEAFQVAAAMAFGAERIVTRNLAPYPSRLPPAFLKQLP